MNTFVSDLVQSVSGSSVGASVASASSAAAGQILATPQKICRSISKALGKKLAESHFSTSFFDKEDSSTSRKKSAKNDSANSNASEDPYFSNVGPKFDMIASATLTLDDCSDGNKYDVILQNAFTLCPTIVSTDFTIVKLGKGKQKIVFIVIRLFYKVENFTKHLTLHTILTIKWLWVRILQPIGDENINWQIGQKGPQQLLKDKCQKM